MGAYDGGHGRPGLRVATASDDLIKRFAAFEKRIASLEDTARANVAYIITLQRAVKGIGEQTCRLLKVVEKLATHIAGE